MNIRVFNQRFLEPGSMLLMVLGIVALCQPWIVGLHQWSVTMMLVGLIGFNVAVHIPAPEQEATEGHEHG
jgi:type IV secretory pathway VirB2 component (pilin)